MAAAVAGGASKGKLMPAADDPLTLSMMQGGAEDEERTPPQSGGASAAIGLVAGSDTNVPSPHTVIANGNSALFTSNDVLDEMNSLIGAESRAGPYGGGGLAPPCGQEQGKHFREGPPSPLGYGYASTDQVEWGGVGAEDEAEGGQGQRAFNGYGGGGGGGGGGGEGGSQDFVGYGGGNADGAAGVGSRISSPPPLQGHPPSGGGAKRTLGSVHSFYLTTFLKPTFCDACSKFIVGVIMQGLRCGTCGLSVHQHCQYMVCSATHKCRQPEKVTLQDDLSDAVPGVSVPSAKMVVAGGPPGQGQGADANGAPLALAASHSQDPIHSTWHIQLVKNNHLWVPDRSAPCCMVCSKGFNFVRRRHHCRRCGACVCAVCSGNRMCDKVLYIDSSSGKVRRCRVAQPVRTCALCTQVMDEVLARALKARGWGKSPRGGDPRGHADSVRQRQQQQQQQSNDVSHGAAEGGYSYAGQGMSQGHAGGDFGEDAHQQHLGAASPSGPNTAYGGGYGGYGEAGGENLAYGYGGGGAPGGMGMGETRRGPDGREQPHRASSSGGFPPAPPAAGQEHQQQQAYGQRQQQQYGYGEEEGQAQACEDGADDLPLGEQAYAQQQGQTYPPQDPFAYDEFGFQIQSSQQDREQGQGRGTAAGDGLQQGEWVESTEEDTSRVVL